MYIGCRLMGFDGIGPGKGGLGCCYEADNMMMRLGCALWTELIAQLECANSKTCSPAKHHYDECVERVTGQIDADGKASEDCVEECKTKLSPTT
jgi:hypothetical protein